MLISSEILFHALEGIPAWSQGVKTSIVTRVCPGLLNTNTQYRFPSAYLNCCQLLGL